jgi:LmbE family N-acetylglucosaminyl deacetylase
MAPLRLLFVLAHPDDESFGAGGTIAKYAAAGADTHLLVATRGERGWKGPADARPDRARLGELRTAELAAAARVLGLRGHDFLGYVDGELADADAGEASGRIRDHLRGLRPHVVVTFGPDGAYGHPDHVAIAQWTTAAVLRAADPGDAPDRGAPFAVPKLYYFVQTEAAARAYERAFGGGRIVVDGVARAAVAWPDWAITTRIDTSEHRDTVHRAVACHRTQLRDPEAVDRFPDAVRRTLWGEATYYRALSLVNGDRSEDDLFAGFDAPAGVGTGRGETDHPARAFAIGAASPWRPDPARRVHARA